MLSPQILPFAAVGATFTSFLTDEAAAQGGKACFKAPSVFPFPYDDLLWRALLVLHWLFGTEWSAFLLPLRVVWGRLGWESCVNFSKHLPEDLGCSMVVGRIAVADSLAGRSCYRPCQPTFFMPTSSPARAIQTGDEVVATGRAKRKAYLCGGYCGPWL